MYHQKIMPLLIIGILSITAIGCQSPETGQDDNQSDNSINQPAEDDQAGLITNQPDSENNLETVAGTLFENETAGYNIAYLDGVDINQSNPENISFTREDISINIITLDNPPQYDLVTFIATSENFSWHYQLADYRGRKESGKKLIFTGKGADVLAPVYYYAKDNKVYKITAVKDEAKVLDYIASTFSFR